jgi:hypothetical protein
LRLITTAPFLCASSLLSRLNPIRIAQILEVAALKVVGVQSFDTDYAPIGWPAAALRVRQKSGYHADDTVELLENRVLPDAYDPPAISLELDCLSAVALNVFAQLSLPEPIVTARPYVVLGAAVPEAAIDEDCDPGAGERDIGPADSCRPLNAVTQAGLPKRGAEDAFGFGVTAANATHLLRAGETHLS